MHEVTYNEDYNYWDDDKLGYDLAACLHYNPQDLLGPEDIEEVLAVWEGERDGDDWRWVVRLKGDLFAFIQGGCDYTGWDCQSWATSEIKATPEEAAFLASGEDLPVGGLWPPQGFGRMISILAGEYMQNGDEVTASLLAQIEQGRNTTWREEKDEELGVVSKFAGPSYD